MLKVPVFVNTTYIYIYIYINIYIYTYTYLYIIYIYIYIYIYFTIVFNFYITSQYDSLFLPGDCTFLRWFCVNVYYKKKGFFKTV